MCTVFIAVAGAASELGMSSALIQKKEDKEAEKLYSTSFWTSIFWGIGIYTTIALMVGPFAARFYGEPILVQLIPVLSIGILLKPLVMVHTVKLTRAMDFKRIAKILNISALIAGIVSISSAYLGFGVWALVLNNILVPILSIPLFYRATYWMPALNWNKDHFKEIFGFGAYSTGTSIFSTLTYNVDNLMIGKLLGAGPLGAYSLSFSLTEQLRQVFSSVMNRVMYPVFGKNQDNKKKLLNYFLKIINFNAIAIYPLMTFFLLFGSEIILGFFGSEWEGAIIPLKVLALAMMVHLLVNSFASLIRGLGKPKLEMKIIIGLTVFVLIPSLYVGISLYGLLGAALAILLNKICLATTGIWVLKKEIGLNIKALYMAVRNPIFGVLISGGIVYALQNIGIDKLYFTIPIYILCYCAILYKLEFENIKVLFKNLK